jgi:hypothetical protein
MTPAKLLIKTGNLNAKQIYNYFIGQIAFDISKSDNIEIPNSSYLLFSG